ncbi:Aste57867_22724 [Aphanomyces stellatus]|uniref:Aste57867_22724 protein n=1 Tax=Aphanomyces stellatus TaxID=120398 RepID=A0A485LMG2_9STRA|nr:hypothetical protein As57867_022654 [Aphanomyces stellatus]VFT99377.1 Aste57867_22724 [Aphanomyces stellatus]
MLFSSLVLLAVWAAVARPAPDRASLDLPVLHVQAAPPRPLAFLATKKHKKHINPPALFMMASRDHGDSVLAAQGKKKPHKMKPVLLATDGGGTSVLQNQLDAFRLMPRGTCAACAARGCNKCTAFKLMPAARCVAPTGGNVCTRYKLMPPRDRGHGNNNVGTDGGWWNFDGVNVDGDGTGGIVPWANDNANDDAGNTPGGEDGHAAAGGSGGSTATPTGDSGGGTHPSGGGKSSTPAGGGATGGPNAADNTGSLGTTAPPPSTDDNSPKKNSQDNATTPTAAKPTGLSGAAIGGICAAVVALVVLAGFGLAKYIQKKKQDADFVHDMHDGDVEAGAHTPYGAM